LTTTTTVTLSVLVPRPGSQADLAIRTGSGIVTVDPTADKVEVYYEGNLYGASGLETFEDKVRRAAERLVDRYPTIAKGRWARTDFDVIGTYTFTADWKDRWLSITTDGREILRRWSPTTTLQS
jgi:hypothetical protein